MKAVVCAGSEQPLQLEEVAMPTAGPGEVIVQVKAAALNHRDWWIRQGQYANLRYPIILGSDGSGMVYEVGENVSIDWLHKEVVINPAMNWGDHPEFQSPSFKILGLPDNGCFAQFVKVPANALFPKPSYLSFQEAAALPLAALTGFRALFTKGGIRKGDHVLLTGIGGGVALMMLQMAVAIGAHVHVTSGDDLKIEKAKKLGAIGGVNYKTEGWHKLLQVSAEGFDLIVDSAAGEGFRHFIDLAKPGARIIFFGGTQGAITQLNPQKIFWKQLQIKGTTMGTPEEFEAMLQLFETHHIHPVIDRVFPMEEADVAIHKMENASQFGKIVLRME